VSLVQASFVINRIKSLLLQKTSQPSTRPRDTAHTLGWERRRVNHREWMLDLESSLERYQSQTRDTERCGEAQHAERNSFETRWERGILWQIRIAGPSRARVPSGLAPDAYRRAGGGASGPPVERPPLSQVR